MKRIHDTHGIDFLEYDISFKGICPKWGEDEGGAEWIKKRCIS